MALPWVVEALDVVEHAGSGGIAATIDHVGCPSSLHTTLDLPGFGGEHLAHFPGHSLEGSGALTSSGRW